jgi:HupE / UreJ protein
MNRLFASLLILASAAPAAAHTASDSFLTLSGAEGKWDLAIRDIDDALILDVDGNGEVTWGEIAGREDAIADYALSRLSVGTPGGPCAVRPGPAALSKHTDSMYVSFPLRLVCPEGATSLIIGYRLFFDRDRQHRGLVRVDGGETLVFSPGRTEQTVSLRDGPGALRTFAAFVAEGAHHVAGGLDHILFLVALLLPAVLRRQGGRWVPAAGLRGTLAEVAKVVTAFTAAHSVTLSLAVLGFARLPSRLVEPAIAVSVAVAALENLRPVFGPKRWVVAMTLGLLHGFGFSSALSDLGLAGARLAPALVGFNVGVELGQLGLVAAVVPLSFLARRTIAYRRWILVGGSAAIAALALVWSIERALGVSFWR